MENQEATVEEILKEHGEYISQTMGYSMAPMLRNRTDTIVVVPVQGRLKKYDVALYRVKGKLVLHRIIGFSKNGAYLIRGDNLYQVEYIRRRRVFGVLKEFYRNGKKYDCETDWRYRLYIRLMLLDYPRRWLLHKLSSAFKGEK